MQAKLTWDQAITMIGATVSPTDTNRFRGRLLALYDGGELAEETVPIGAIDYMRQRYRPEIPSSP
jgi:hypothetical protein